MERKEVSNNMATRRDKKALRQQIYHILDTKCANCEKNKQISSKSGKWWNVARNDLQRYCLGECPVGRELREIGRMIEGEPEPAKPKKEPQKPKRKLQKFTVTIPQYVEAKRGTKTDKEVAEKLNVNYRTLMWNKRKWQEQGLLAECE
jgi:hypothetical protein